MTLLKKFSSFSLKWFIINICFPLQNTFSAIVEDAKAALTSEHVLGNRMLEVKIATSKWDLVFDKQIIKEKQPLEVAKCTKIFSPNTEDANYVINVKQIANIVVGLGDKVSPTDIEEGM